MDRQQIKTILATISQAWGPSDNTGYVFFPRIDRIEQVATEGKEGFHEQSFEWPADREQIVNYLMAHQGYDVYWCPMVFDSPMRRSETAHEEYSLWADLDEADPRMIDEEWRPTIAWETSPGRYQALWLLEDPEAEDLYGAAREDGENRQMTYMLEADPSGWDITQLLRIPGWTNHKPEYAGGGGSPEGRLLWVDGPRYEAANFNDLPPLPAGFRTVVFDEDLLEEVLGVDRKAVAKRISQELSRKAKELLKAKSTDGQDRSKILWYLAQSLAEAGCNVAEIIALIRPTVWNKYDGRADELRRLGNEAATAVKNAEDKEQQTQRPEPMSWRACMSEVTAPEWLIPGILTRGSVGFIAGEPKTRKSWVGLDLAFSVAMSSQGYDVKFLNQFNVVNPGPVLFMLLEDAVYLAKKRGQRIWEAKTEGRVGPITVHTNGEGRPEVTMGGDIDPIPDPKISIIHSVSLDLSDQVDQEWLAHQIGSGYGEEHEPYCLLIIDTLMRAAGSVDENRSYELMHKLLGPLTRLSRRYRLNIAVVNHFNKATDGRRAGQRILGAQANHAWAEDSIYLFKEPDGSLRMETESKSAAEKTFRFEMSPTAHRWQPRLTRIDGDAQPRELDFIHTPDRPQPRTEGGRIYTSARALATLPPGLHTTREVMQVTGEEYSLTRQQLVYAAKRGRIEKVDSRWRAIPGVDLR